MPALGSPPASSPSPSPALLPRACDTTSTPPMPIPINPPCGAKATLIDNSLFSGAVFIKMRGVEGEGGGEVEGAEEVVGDCSGPRSCAPVMGGCGTSSAARCHCPASFFSTNPRCQLELTVQGRFLSSTTNPLYMGAELSGPVPFTLQLSWLRRSLIKVIAQLISTFVSNVSWTLGNPATGESPLISFPLVKAMDRIHSTPLSSTEEAPPLGWQRLPPSLPAFSKASINLTDRFNPASLYSFCFYSDNLDLKHWRAVNLQGLPDVDLHSLWKQHPLRLLCYELVDQTGIHSEANRRTYFSLLIQPPNGRQVEGKEVDSEA